MDEMVIQQGETDISQPAVSDRGLKYSLMDVNEELAEDSPLIAVEQT